MANLGHCLSKKDFVDVIGPFVFAKWWNLAKLKFSINNKRLIFTCSYMIWLISKSLFRCKKIHGKCNCGRDPTNPIKD
jgi:hypothetical protein